MGEPILSVENLSVSFDTYAGEVRAVNHIQNRVSEAYRLGFVCCMVPRHNLSQLNTEQMPDLEVIPVSSINEACKIIGRNKTE